MDIMPHFYVFGDQWTLHPRHWSSGTGKDTFVRTQNRTFLSKLADYVLRQKGKLSSIENDDRLFKIKG